MAIPQIDPPPNTDDIRVIRNWANDFYEQINFAMANIDSDNMTENFLKRLNLSEGDE